MSTHLLFDDDGAFKAGTEMANAGTSHQVELPSGKRTKVKSSHVLLRFADGWDLAEAHSAMTGYVDKCERRVRSSSVNKDAR